MRNLQKTVDLISGFRHNGIMMNAIGNEMKVLYKGIEYYVISIFEDGADVSFDRFEIAPTRHGAGSFYVTREYLQEV